MLPIFGYAALNEIGEKAIVAANPAGNAAGPMLAQEVGGDILYALVAGVTIATILAVLAGMAIAVSGAVAHDLYTSVLKRGDVDERGQLITGRLAGAVSAGIAILLALGAKDLNIANVANIAFAIAATTTMPTLLLTIYWRRFNQIGALFAMIGGLIVSLVLVLLGPDVLGKDDAIFPLAIPALVSVPAGFLLAYIGTLIGAGRVGSTGMPYDEFERRAFAPDEDAGTAAASPAGRRSPSGWARCDGRRPALPRARRRRPAAGRGVARAGGAGPRPPSASATLADKQGLELEQGELLADVLADPEAGAHLVESMLRPTEEALERLDDFRATGVADLGAAHLERRGRAGVLELRNPRHLNAEDDATLPATEVAVDLALLDPAIEVGVFRGGVVEHQRYAGRRDLRRRHQPHAALPRRGLLRASTWSATSATSTSSTAGCPAPSRRRSCGSPRVETYAIGGACQLLHVMDHVIAERGARLFLPARKEGIIPGASNLRLPRAVGARLARQAILSGREFVAGTPEGDLLVDETVEREEIDAAIDARVEALTSSGLVNAAANRRALRVGEEPLDIFRAYMAMYAREQARLPPQPGARREPGAQLEREGARVCSSGCRARSCAALQLERLRATVARLLDSPSPLGARLRDAGVDVGGGIGSLDDLARLPFTEKADLREHYPFGLLAVPRERLARVHASSGTGGKPTIVGYTARRPRRLGRGDGALHGDGGRPPRDARPQRLRLRAVHRRPRLPPRRRAARRDRPPGLRRPDPAPGDAAARPAGAGAVLHAVLRAARSPRRSRRRGSGPTTCRSRSGCSAPSRGRRRCASSSSAGSACARATSTGCRRSSGPASPPSATRPTART